MLQRETITGMLRDALLPRDTVLALFEGGAAAFNRADEWSDIDLVCVVRDDAVEPTFDVIEGVLKSLSAIDIEYTIPQPSWHGHGQKFYRLTEAGPFRLIDLTVIKQSAPNKFLEPEIHGNPVVHFDKAGIAAAEPPVERARLADVLWSRVESMRITFPLFQSFTLKELNRGNAVDALVFYHSFTLAPLVELLRIHHSPFHYNFRSRYLYYDLPKDIAERMEALYFVSNTDDLRLKHERAGKWFEELMSSTTRPTLAEE